jgi:hypothetical protein
MSSPYPMPSDGGVLLFSALAAKSALLLLMVIAAILPSRRGAHTRRSFQLVLGAHDNGLGDTDSQCR